MYALPSARWQRSRATSGVSLVFAGLAISLSVARVLASDRMFRNGDCPSCAEIACFKVSSKTASPVVLLKSASTTVSCSVRIGGRCERQYNPPATMAATNSA